MAAHENHIDTLTATDRELDVLAHVHEAAESETKASQRSIARALGMSVGLTNAILKRLASKGLVMVRRINHNNVHYLVTPEGVEQIGRRSYRYLRRTIGHVVRYRDRLRTFCRDQQREGIREIVLVGSSDLAFLLEWCAGKEGLGFTHVAEPAADRRNSSARDDRAKLFVYSEAYSRVDAALTLTEVLVDGG